MLQSRSYTLYNVYIRTYGCIRHDCILIVHSKFGRVYFRVYPRLLQLTSMRTRINKLNCHGTLAYIHTHIHTYIYTDTNWTMMEL